MPSGLCTSPWRTRWTRSAGMLTSLRRPVDSTVVTERSLVKQLAASPDGPVTVSGWAETVRDQKKVQFVILRDETGAVQLVHPRGAEGEADAIADTISDLTHGTFFTVTGQLKH